MFSTVCRKASIIFLISGVQRFSSSDLPMFSKVFSCVFFKWLHWIVPYSSTIWFRNWKTGR